MIEVRDAEVSDADAIAGLAGELGYAASPALMCDRLRALLPRADRRIRVAEAEGVVVGWIESERRLTLDSADRVEILGLVVGAGARRRGVGATLVEDAEAWTRGLGIDVLTVRSNVLRDESHPFYEGQGFARSKTQHYYRKALVH